ncbi:2cd503ec-0659-4498-9648-c2302a1a5d74 [Sclerotinia trifoliorum]|uniref:2cd503ec-0659-4498-9648-c2302a1a5d74 n=1 Tax=Sclerotinia trifoliorum TaxID=28548 RepID=A0A8H2VT65_9HELO|nr:2cd503ec-0659-4498-9648-c2302a1a5d74 [Sclerotinia trifoliorum]
MDARPQRPLRFTHTNTDGDENIAPLITKQQSTLHQKHKSTGTLASMLAVGGLKAAAKRTAFGDVSNTAKTLNNIHDESGIKGKSVEAIKPIAIQDKSAALLKPAQRPLNNGHRAPLATSTSEQVSIAPLPKQFQTNQTKRNTLGKKGAVYKDTGIENIQPLAQKPIASTSSAQQTLGPRHAKSQPEIKAEQPVLRRTQSKQLNNVVDNVEPAIYHNAPEHPLKENVNESHLRSIREKEESAVIEKLKSQKQLPALPLAPEPEEYWPEDEEEAYDEQGYTTAHSFRGENTTGGATTIIVPKVTNKVKKELEDARILVESVRTQEDIEDEMWDTSMVAEYGEEIFSYMRELENKLLPDPHYMDTQAEIQWSMRSVLMDWLIQVHQRFSLLPETLFLCVNYIDRFLSKKVVSLGKLQLVGATAIFVAAKYEEINCPSIGEIVYMVDGGYSSEEILKAERFMLSMLQFELGWPGPMSFLRRISKADDYDLETRTLAKYFLEVTIMDERFVGSPPSFVAAASHAVARFMLGKGDWSPAHVYYSGYTWNQLKPLVSLVIECCENARKHHAAVFEKYSDRRYKRASTYVEDQMIKGFQIPGIVRRQPSIPAPLRLEPQYQAVAFDPLLSIEENSQRMIQARS